VLVFSFLVFRAGAGEFVRELFPPVAATPTPEAVRVAEELGVGVWMWTTNYADKQTVRFWRSFQVPSDPRVERATLKITADNVYRFYLDGREIGSGGNYRSLTEYDLTLLITPGRHVLAVEGFNDSLEGAVLLGLRIEFAGGERMEVLSDESWYVVPNDVTHWERKKKPDANWTKAKAVGVLGQEPWWLRPISIIPTPRIHPIRVPFWERGWFLGAVLALCALAFAMAVRLAARLAVQTRAQELLDRERMRIARDIHDDLGASLTQLVLRGEVAQTELAADSAARARLEELCDRARAVSQALDEIVWAVNSRRDTLKDFSSYLCKYAQNFLASTPIRCRLDVQGDMGAAVFDLPVRRSLFLAVKEALNNAAKHSGAKELFLRIRRDGDKVVVVVEDDGVGFDPAASGAEGNGLANMSERLSELGGECHLFSRPGAGCRVEFRMPLLYSRRGRFRWLPRVFEGRQAFNGAPEPDRARNAARGRTTG